MSESRLDKMMSSFVPIPMCVINRQGKVVTANDKISEVFLYGGIKDADIFALTGIKVGDLYEAAETPDVERQLLIERNEKFFKLITQKVTEDDEDSDLTIIFNDVTGLELLKNKYMQEKFCVAKIQVDNYDELTSGTSTEMRMTLSGEIDRNIRIWSQKINASVNRVSNNLYILWFEYLNLEKLIANKFDILDVIRDIETDTDFPASLSIGVGVGGETPAQSEDYADAALDLALGRGGDQAVIKKGSKVQYYGGKLQAVEKSNKGKSRIFGHALKQLVEHSRRIFIMGHKNPDMDCFGAALGISRLCEGFNKKPFIVIDDYNDALQKIYESARDSELYNLINNEKAISSIDSDCLVIVLDTNRPSMTQCPQLLEMTEKIVVIDHHRKMEEFIENPVLAYMESYASSTCELVAEILQFMTSKKSLVKLEAEALLAGISVDTNGFVIRTGVRTFEAAAWLRRQGADTAEVKRFFQKDQASFKINAQALADAEFYDNGVAISVCCEPHSDEQVICAQVADKLLTVRGVKTSFVIGENSDGKTVISARSLGDVNVQVIMEKFGGGGHLTTAAAQVNLPKDTVKCKILEIMEGKENDSNS